MPVHDHIDHAVFGEIFGTLETGRQLLTDGLFDDARTGKADQRSRFGNMHVAEHGIGRGDATRGRVGQNDQIGQPSLAYHLHADSGARQLHQRQNAFLHARAA